MATWGIGLAVGVVAWTLLEYVLHRWVFHRRVLGRRAARGHLEHHAKVDFFYPVGGKLVMAAIVLTPIVIVCALALGWQLGSSIPVGIVVGWLIYEWIHRRIHVAAPIGAYGRWARRHHLHHHFQRADCNHGVSTPLWDVVFGTLAPREQVRVPRAHARKFPWLIEGDEPRIASAWASEYRIV
ncbi:sterol desaturase family protein [Sandaracinus amylolyticus]|uniref:sterol desaturase family protein n=1 Tax=Sandaracinus amylolyticus TaxID=927083 RepID=UPI00069DF20E|nr:sterol desaturase family protein [Sandaracinus amylolyticus]